MANKSIACYGEVMLRLTAPNYERFEQATMFDVSFAGAEANVAVNLSTWGLDSKYLTVLPNNPLGNKCLNDLLRHRVDAANILKTDGRLGTMFLEKGSTQRGSYVIYDRKDSVISETKLNSEYFSDAFKNCDWFHYTGITPALSQTALNNCHLATKTAGDLGITISTDLNYRSKLWKYGKKATDVMPDLVINSDVIIGNEDDALNALGIEGTGLDINKEILPQEAYGQIAEKIFANYPKCKILAFSLRESINANNNNWSGILFTREKVYQSNVYQITDIVDRVGSGDSFASGIIYGLRKFEDFQKTLDFAVAASCLKHSIHGDYCIATVKEIEAIMTGVNTGRIIR